jgi:predicted nucleic acid-binding protein
MTVVLDTNVLVAGLRSAKGASFRLLTQIKNQRVFPAVTTPLMVEYESVLLRPCLIPPPLTAADISAFLDWFCHTASHHRVHYLWRPHLADPQDDLVLEATMAAGAGFLIPFNGRHFRGLAPLGIEVLTPTQFLQRFRL